VGGKPGRKTRHCSVSQGAPVLGNPTAEPSGTRKKVRAGPEVIQILDPTNKCTDFNNRLKEFSALYEIVKNERTVHEPHPGLLLPYS
jgi:hypothetical protein